MVVYVNIGVPKLFERIEELQQKGKERTQRRFIKLIQGAEELLVSIQERQKECEINPLSTFRLSF